MSVGSIHKKSGSWPISRVLSWTIIRLGLQSLTGSSNLPVSDAGHTMETYLVLLRVEFTLLCTVTRHTVRSYRTLSPLPAETGGLLSAALVVGFTRPGVTWHPTLWSPDFPPPHNEYEAAIVWPTPKSIVLGNDDWRYALFIFYYCRFGHIPCFDNGKII